MRPHRTRRVGSRRRGSAIAIRPSNVAIDIVETAYRAAVRTPDRWIDEVLAVAGPALDRGRQTFAYEYDTRGPYSEWITRTVVHAGDHSFVDQLRATFADTPRALNEYVHRRAGAVTILSELIGVTARASDGIGPHAEKFAVDDMFGVNASDPSGRGTYFCATSPRTLERSRIDIALWERIGAHVTAAGRLRRVLAESHAPDAVLSPDGRVLHAERRAEPALAALARNARVIDRARTRRHRRDPESLASWRALVEGRWSLVDSIDGDGRRVLFALVNPPAAPDPRKLTKQERIIAGFAAMGHSNKLIAYELGLSLGTVSRHMHAVLAKLGVRSRVELVDRVALLDDGTTTRFDSPKDLVALASPRSESASSSSAIDDVLTDAERVVARLAARGQSNAQIARTRGVAERTVSNQLASAYAKLGVQSRSELALRLAEK